MTHSLDLMPGCAKNTAPFLTLLLKGGLGNQLFQIGAALAECEVTGQSLRVACPSYWSDRKRRPDALLLYPEITRVSLRNELMLAPLVSARIANSAALRPWVLTDRDAAAIATATRRRRWVSGYFQHRRFSESAAVRLRERLMQEAVPEQSPYIAVHVRRSDFLALPVLRGEYHFLMASYYGPAIARAQQMLGRTARVVLVSDDPAGAAADLRQVLANDVLIVAANSTDMWQDLACLARADALVSSNSTFCWWAARVNRAIVFLPQRWLHREHARPGCGFNLNLPGAIVV